MISVVLVDDQTMIRAGLRGILEDGGIEIVAEAPDGRAGVAAIRRAHPDAVLMDLRMPLVDGVTAIREIRADPDLADIRVLVLTTFDGDDDVVAALAAGADGFLSKTADPDELVEAVFAVARGRAALSDSATRAVLRHLGSTRRPEPDPELTARAGSLTPRERDIVAAAAKGADNMQIARELFISPYTVKTHLNRAMAKLGARDRGQLVALAYQANITAAP
jgi:DNA-binding NarL/FixJ family response regulator